jgi:hypothetical protein
VQALHQFGLNRSVRSRPDCEQKITAFAGNVGERLNQLLDRLKIVIVTVIEPVAIGGHAGFPWPKIFGLGSDPRHRIVNYLEVVAGDAPGGHTLGQVLLGRIEIPSHAEAVIHQRVGLQVVNQAEVATASNHITATGP